MTTLDQDAAPPSLCYTALFMRFLRFGLLAFGGPVAQIAMIRRELVDQDRWISSAHFNRLLAVLQILPGPEAHELCVHMAMRARGRVGGLLAGLGFMLPGLVIMLGIGWAYVSLTPVMGLLACAFLGMQSAVVAVVMRAVHKIGGHILEGRLLWATAAVGFLDTLAGASFWIVLIASGAAYALAKAGRRTPALAFVAVALVAVVLLRHLSTAPAAHAAEAADPTQWAMLWSGLKAGLLSFGGAYTAIPYVRSDTVGKGLIDDGTFLDGLAFAGVIPAPLVIFCTFVGFVVGGWMGPVAMTVGVAAAVVGIIAATSLQLGWATLQRVPSVPIALAIFALAFSAVWFWKSRYATPAVLALAALAGWVLLQ